LELGEENSGVETEQVLVMLCMINAGAAKSGRAWFPMSLQK